jgi:carboxyl-terminal processing protease
VTKKVTLIILTAAATLLLINTFVTATFTQVNPSRVQFLSQLIHSGLESLHYSKKKIDNDFSEKAFNEFLKVLDPNKYYLLQKDIDELQKYKDDVDDQFADGSTELMDLAEKRILERIGEVRNFYEELLSKPFDFSVDESLELDADKQSYCTDKAQIKDLWRKVLKYRTLIRYINLLKAEKKTGPDPKLEEKARKAVTKSFKNFFNRLQQTYEKDALSIYFNSLVQVYDPHTSYLPPLDKETFDLSMSGSFEGIGALLNEEDGYVKVASIVPGGPSWKQKQLQPGDAILKVGQGDAEPEDIVGMRVQDAVKLIRGKKGTTVRLNVKRPDGQIVDIAIVRDVVVLEETFAKSAVVIPENGSKPHRFGYIYLPKFYNDFKHRDGRSSTNDVRKELEKLKAKKVEGVILDLRNNGGGALDDAVNMSGLFIPEGPIVQVNDLKVGTQVLKDRDPETVYKGPLIVMVNSLSASASEILAAALQDYGRAVIVGSNQSFGKGTVQAMINLDRYLSRKEGYDKALGALTITVQKFYRINGTSIQQRGVVPDVILPDQFSSLEIGEKYLDYSLSWDTISPAEYTKWSLTPPNVQMLAEKSRKRVDANPEFTVLEEYVRKVKEIQHKTLQSLKLDVVTKEQEQLRVERERFNKSQEKHCRVKVEPSREIVKKTSEELYKIELDRQKEWFDGIEKDLLLNEAMMVLTDMVGM